MSSEQLKAWEGGFGGDYHVRNHWADIRPRTRLWAEILGDIQPREILEVGAGTGTNLMALSAITGAGLLAMEPNAGARGILDQIPVIDGQGCRIGVFDGTAANLGEFVANEIELVFTSGVLIHIPPDELDAALDEIYRVSSRYIACIEYFAAEPEMKKYRGRDNLLFKRDFGGYWMDRYPDLKVINYGFAWKRVTGLDNLTWWLFSKG